MDRDLGPFQAALTGCTGVELFALIDAANDSPSRTAKLLGWLEAACLWEWDRRTGRTYDLQPPENDMSASERAANLEALTALRAAFVHDSAATRRLFDALRKLVAVDPPR